MPAATVLAPTAPPKMLAEKTVTALGKEYRITLYQSGDKAEDRSWTITYVLLNKIVARGLVRQSTYSVDNRHGKAVAAVVVQVKKLSAEHGKVSQ